MQHNGVGERVIDISVKLKELTQTLYIINAVAGPFANKLRYWDIYAFFSVAVLALKYFYFY